MTLVKHNYFNVLNGKLTYSSAELEIIPNQMETNEIVIASETTPFKSQGMIECGYEHWNQSAKKALELALQSLALEEKFHITIKKLEGRILLDTNNAAIGVSCILTLWKFLNIQPSTETMNRLHFFVSKDWENDPSMIPDFRSIINVLKS